MDDLEYLKGRFYRTIYQTNTYMVSVFIADEDTITVTGPYFEYENNQIYVLSGNYVDHPRYGFQFNYMLIEKYLPSIKEEIISFLSSNSFIGIGKKTAVKIYDYFLDETINILKADPLKIYDIKLTDKQYQSIIDGFNYLNDPENDTIFYLISNGFNNNDAQKIFSVFKLDTMQIASDNPFRFYNDVYGISFDKVSTFASKLEFTDSEIKYLESYLIYLLIEYTFKTGDIYISMDDLNNLLLKNHIQFDSQSILQRAIENSYLIQEEDRIYLYNDYNDEIFIANFLKNFSQSFNIDENIIDQNIEFIENGDGITYDDKQCLAIKNFLLNSFSLITGGPGTGKTTIVKTMSMIFKKMFPFSNLIVVAPTGRAAKRISEICDVESKTIHSLLRWNKETNTFVHNIDNPILYDCIIIDEFSMVDNSLFASLLKACSKVKKICIIGDNNQLPSIKPGDLLNDLLTADLYPTTYLSFNYRQNQGNEIITLANDIINDEIDLSKFKKDITFYDINNDNYDLLSLIQKNIEDGYTLDEIQILTPMHKGSWGIENLNILLQNTFNPQDKNKKERKIGKYTFREKDKILQLKNRPNDDVYNGDIGTLVEIDDSQGYLLVDYAGTLVFYDFDDLADITLAYAFSVHKAQGSEYNIVYLIISRYNTKMLNSKLIYTAISRSKDKLIIISEQDLLKEGISKTLKKRNTTLLERL